MRSVWKGEYVPMSIMKMDVTKTKEPIRIWARSAIILSKFVGKRVEIHNGKSFVPLIIQENHVGHRFGEFAFTTRLGNIIHVVNKKKKKKRR